jgi:hypothetical protein
MRSILRVLSTETYLFLLRGDLRRMHGCKIIYRGFPRIEYRRLDKHLIKLVLNEFVKKSKLIKTA